MDKDINIFHKIHYYESGELNINYLMRLKAIFTYRKIGGFIFF